MSIFLEYYFDVKGPTMHSANRKLCLAAFVAVIGTTAVGTARAADSFAVDPVHSSVSFKIAHQDISFIHGRFNDYSGKFVIDKTDPAKSSFAMSIKTESVDTSNQKRDEHLRAPDYFNVAQFPTMNFQSTSVKSIDGGYEVKGDYTLLGVTKPLTIQLKGGEKVVEFPKGKQRIGFETMFVVKRSEFGLKAGLPAVGDDVHVMIGVEAVKE